MKFENKNILKTDTKQKLKNTSIAFKFRKINSTFHFEF
jgi:hypothetical protein